MVKSQNKDVHAADAKATDESDLYALRACVPDLYPSRVCHRTDSYGSDLFATDESPKGRDSRPALSSCPASYACISREKLERILWRAAARARLLSRMAQ